jgi:uncharacterized membrane protein
MKTNPLLLTFFTLTAICMLFGPEAFAISDSVDGGLNTSVKNLTGILEKNLVPVVLLCGCLAGIAISFMKSSPTPFIVALITTASFGFAHSWINGTYTVCV